MPRIVASKKTVVAEPVELPEASEVASVSSVEEMESPMEDIFSSLKGLSSGDMMKMMKLMVAEKKKEEKEAKKADKKPATKKATAKKEKKEDEPKRPIPRQLLKPKAWVEFNLKHALENGWEEFIINQKKKDKETGEVEEEEIVMPPSELNEDGCFVYEGTVGSAKYPKGRQIIAKEAMSLSKQRWTAKTKTGTHPELYAEFEAEYVEPEDNEDNKSETTDSSSGKTVRRLTAAEKEAEREAAKAAKEAEKAAAKAEKEAEKAAKKAEKEAEKALKAAAKSTTPKKASTSAKTPIPANAVKTVLAAKKAESPTPVAAPAPAPVAAKPTPVVKKPATVVKKVDSWTCPDDGQLYPWTFGGKKYLRAFTGEVYEAEDDGTCGAWAGMFDKTTNKIDDSYPEPEFEDEE